MKLPMSIQTVVFALVISQPLLAINDVIKTINLEIADAQGGASLSEKEEEDPGAFAVANKNDTDGDGTLDTDDNDVSNELDLMLMKINPPSPNDDPNAIVSLAVPGNAKLYKSNDKKGGPEEKRSWPASELPKTVWVELQKESSSVRAEVFTLTGGGAKDTVKATGVWMEKVNFFGDSTGVVPRTFDDAAISPPWKNGNYKLGIELYQTGVKCGMLMEFKVMPTSILDESKVKMDISRKTQYHVTTSANGGAATTFNNFIDRLLDTTDTADDDGNNGDEDVVPSNDFVYDTDRPMIPFPTPPVSHPDFPPNHILQDIANFETWCRVNVGNKATRPGPNMVNAGSRCSDRIKWHSQYRTGYTIVVNNGIQSRSWVLDPKFANEVKEGNVAISFPLP
jgi:hypothetical protein